MATPFAQQPGINQAEVSPVELRYAKITPSPFLFSNLLTLGRLNLIAVKFRFSGVTPICAVVYTPRAFNTLDSLLLLLLLLKLIDALAQ